MKVDVVKPIGAVVREVIDREPKHLAATWELGGVITWIEVRARRTKR